MTHHRRSPRSISAALAPLSSEWTPRTPLAEIQRVWAEAVGGSIAEEAKPVSERAGVVTVACSGSVWAQELDLMAPTLLAAVNAHLGEAAVTRLRCVVRRP